MAKDREYLYTFDVRIDGKWEQLTQVATSMVEVSRVLGVPLDDLRYVTKVIKR